MESIKKLEQALIKQGYIVKLFDTKEAAVSFLNKELDNKIIGIGGTQTVEQMGLYEALVEHNTVYWHDRMPDNMSVMEVRQAAFRAPVYISSVNGKRLSKTERIEQTVLNSVLPVSKAEICDVLQDVSPTTVESVLGKMVKTGSVVKLGQARATKYVNAKYLKKE